jgi:hypothetical protein
LEKGLNSKTGTRKRACNCEMAAGDTTVGPTPFRRQLTVMVNSNFASSSIGQPNIAWPRPSTGPQVFTGLDLSAERQLLAARFPPDSSASVTELRGFRSQLE